MKLVEDVHNVDRCSMVVQVGEALFVLFALGYSYSMYEYCVCLIFVFFLLCFSHLLIIRSSLSQSATT